MHCGYVNTTKDANKFKYELNKKLLKPLAVSYILYIYYISTIYPLYIYMLYCFKVKPNRSWGCDHRSAGDPYQVDVAGRASHDTATGAFDVFLPRVFS